MLARCVAVARGTGGATDQQEANVFRVASMLLSRRFQNEASRLEGASDMYFERCPNEKLSTGEVVDKGWVLGFPRLKDMLSRELDWDVA